MLRSTGGFYSAISGRNTFLSSCSSWFAVNHTQSSFARDFSSSCPNKSTFNVSPENLEILKATLPAVANTGTDLTKYFYTRMFKAVPCLRDVFNNTNQKIGKQPAKLFASVAEAASSVVEGREFDDEMALSIAHKHCGLNVTGPNYNIVGEHLLGTISECLTDDKAVLGAWGELYWQLADQLKEMEENLVKETEAKEGGWKGLREFELFEKKKLGTNIARFHFRPVDGENVCSFTSGQFTTVWAKPEGWTNTQPRHYTLNVPLNPKDYSKFYAVTVRKQGQMSDFLHNADMGTRVQLSAPYGMFNILGAEELWLRDPATPIVFLSAGVGLTPTLAMLEGLEGDKHGPVYWLHASKKGSEHPYRQKLIDLAGTRDWLTRRVWYEFPETLDYQNEEVGEDNLKKFHFEGRMNFGQVEDVVPLKDHRAIYYLCGPAGWMEKAIDDLQENYGVTRDRLKYESF